MPVTEPTPLYYVEYPGADHRYRRQSAGWTRSANPMSKWTDCDKHDWDYVDYADLPLRVRDQYEADKAALNQALSQNDMHAALGLAQAAE